MGREYIVEEILEKRIIDGKIEYFIKWEGFRISESTWEPEENLSNSKDLIKDFLNKEAAKTNSKEIIESNASKETNHMENVIQNSYENKNELRQYEDTPIITELNEDVPKKIRSVKKIDEELYSLVEFEERSDGLVTDPCYVPSLLLRKINPKLLIEFYESKIKFISKK